jgi:hypothetical protein
MNNKNTSKTILIDKTTQETIRIDTTQ